MGAVVASLASIDPGTVKTTLLFVEVMVPTFMFPVSSVIQTLPVAVALTYPAEPTSSSSRPTSPIPPLEATRITPSAALISAAEVLLPSTIAPAASSFTVLVVDVITLVRKSPVCSFSQMEPLAVAVTF